MVNPTVLKLCRQCRERKIIRDFDYPRHRICSRCRRDREASRTGFAVTAGVTIPLTQHATAQMHFNRLDGLPDATGITVSGSGRAKYHRERARNVAAAKRMAEERMRIAAGLPKKIPKSHLLDPAHAVKWCRRCKRNLSVNAFSSLYVRICQECDGPDLGMAHSGRR